MDRSWNRIPPGIAVVLRGVSAVAKAAGKPQVSWPLTRVHHRGLTCCWSVTFPYQVTDTSPLLPLHQICWQRGTPPAPPSTEMWSFFVHHYSLTFYLSIYIYIYIVCIGMTKKQNAVTQLNLINFLWRRGRCCCCTDTRKFHHDESLFTLPPGERSFIRLTFFSTNDYYLMSWLVILVYSERVLSLAVLNFRL